ncbi:MAG: hypothetical protein GX442_01935 [Candidatus Riflebacteria bacterium]|nr:hypothetical protein [Candidatus Riflebacteria bacterium]
MKNLLMRRGVPFLLFLGFLSMASGGYLVYQIWGVPGLAGAASALSTPDEPPALDGPPTLPPPAPGAQPVAGTKTPQPPAPTPDAPGEDEKPVSIPVPHEEAQPESTPAEPPAAKVKERAPAPAPKTPAVAPKAPEAAPKVAPAVKAASEAPKAANAGSPAAKAAPKAKAPVALPVAKAVPAPQPVMTPAGTLQETGKAATRKGRRGSRKVQAEPVSSEVPPEWNWFQRPLELQLVDGKIRIMADGSAAPVAVVEAAPARIEVPAPVDESALAVVPADEEAGPALVAGPQAPGPDPESAPFVIALGKMVRNRDRRSAIAEKAHMVLPSQGGSTGKVPPALIKLQKVIGDLALAAPSAMAPAGDDSSRPATLHKVDHDSLAPSAADGALESEPGQMETERAEDSGRFGMGLREVLRGSGWRAP